MNDLNPPPVEPHQNQDAPEGMSANPQPTGRGRKLAVPPVTMTILVICGAIWAALNFLPKDGHGSSLGDFLAPSAFEVWAGTYWALITAAFVHVDAFHALFNMWWTKDFGKLLEPRFGPVKFILFVIGAAIAGCGWQLACSDQTGIGFSGVVYAFFGYMLATRHRVPAYAAFVNRKTIGWMIGWFFLCIVLTQLHVWKIANAAHGAGLAFGILVGLSTGADRLVIPARLATSLVGVCGMMPLFYMPWSEAWRQREEGGKWIEIERVARGGDAQAQFECAYVRFGIAERLQAEEGRSPSDAEVQSYEMQGAELLKKSAEQGYVPAMNGLAWKLATDPRKNLRNGRESLKWAEKTCEQDQWAAAEYIDTLAAAYAELQRWDRAAAYQELALQQLKPEGSKWKEEMEKKLEEYRRKAAEGRQESR